MAGRDLPPLAIAASVEGATTFVADLQKIRRELATTTAAIKKQASAMTAASVAVGSSISGIGASVSKFGNRMQSVGNQMSQIGSRLTLAFTTMFGGITVGASMAAANFESEMTKIITLVGLTEKEVARLSDVVIDIAPDLGATPQALSEALFVITSAGIRDTAEAQEVLTSASQAAAIGLGEVKDVARITTSILQAYADTGIDAARATDVLTAIVREGNLEADKLAPSLGRVIPIAAQLGVSFEEAGAFISTFTRLGVPAEVAVTSLRASLSAILKPTSGAAEELERYGITMQEVRDAINDPSIGLSKTLIGLVGTLSQNDESLSRVIGNVRGLSGVLGVAGQLSDDYLQILGNINESNGIVADGFERVAQTTTFQWNQAKAAIQVAAIEIGGAILPTLNQMLQSVVEVSKAIAEFARQNPQLVESAIRFLAIGAAVGPLVFVVGSLISAVGGAISVIGALIGLLGTLVTVTLSSAAGIAGLATAFILLFVDVEDEASSFFGGFASSMKTHGQNIVEAFGEGMIDGLIAVIDALNQIGQTIAFWLESFSPPRLLPDLSKWGAGAMTAYMEGWTMGDFSIFEEIFDTVEGFLSAMPGMKRKELPNLLLGFGQSLAIAINDVRATGRVTDDVIKSITSSIANATPEVEEYVKAVFDAALVNDKFSAALAPIDQRLLEISDRRKEIENELEREKLDKVLSDVFADPRAIELAELRLEEIDLQERKTAIERRRDMELKIAQDRLDIAKSLLDIQEDTNSLLKEILEATKKNRPARGGGARGGGAGGRISAKGLQLPDITRGLTEAQKKLAEKLGIGEDGPFSRIQETVSELTGDITRLGESFDGLKKTLGRLKPFAGDFLKWTLAVIIGFKVIRAIGFSNIMLFLGRVIGSVVIPAITGLATFITGTLLPAIWGVLSPILALLLSFSAIPLLILIALGSLALLVIKFGGVEEAIEAVKDTLPRLWEQFKEVIRLMVDRMSEFVDENLPEWARSIGDFFSGLLDDFFSWGASIARQLIDGFFSTGIGNMISDALNLPGTSTPTQTQPGGVRGAPSGGGGGARGPRRSGPPPSFVNPSRSGNQGVNVNISTGDINNTTDLNGFTRRVEQAVVDAMR